MSFLLKVHNSPGGKILGICDADLLGGHLEENSLVLDVGREFFGGENAGIAEIISAIKGCKTANIIGNGVIDVLIAKGIISKPSVRTVQGIKTAHIYKI